MFERRVSKPTNDRLCRQSDQVRFSMLNNNIIVVDTFFFSSKIRRRWCKSKSYLVIFKFIFFEITHVILLRRHTLNRLMAWKNRPAVC
jgi:hypothetical protein